MIYEIQAVFPQWCLTLENASHAVVENGLEYTLKYGSKLIPLIDIGISIYEDIKENDEAIQHNNRIDERIGVIYENTKCKDYIAKLSSKGSINMQLVCKDGRFYIERYSINVGDLQKKIDAYESHEEIQNEEDKFTPYDMEEYLSGKGDKDSEIEKYFEKYNPNLQ